ncbi:MAG: carboxymuconolactone decarboxylase family protein [Candidatus Acidiferrales bacterium]
MARVRPIPRERAALILRNVYDSAERQFGSTPLITRALAHRPELLLTFANFERELWTGGVLDAKTKALIAVRVSALNSCAYSLARHRAAARQAGVSEEQLAALEGGAASAAAVFEAREQAVLRLAEKLTREAGAVSDDDVQGLRKWYGDSHLVELALFVGALNLLDHFALAFALEAEPAGSGPA